MAKKKVARVGPLASVIASGVKKGKTIYLSGQVSVDEKGAVVGTGDFHAQVRQAYANVLEVLEEFGADMDDIVDETWFVTDVGHVMNDVAGMVRVRRECFGGEPDVTQTLVEISSLVMPELMVEIKCIARR